MCVLGRTDVTARTTSGVRTETMCFVARALGELSWPSTQLCVRTDRFQLGGRARLPANGTLLCHPFTDVFRNSHRRNYNLHTGSSASRIRDNSRQLTSLNQRKGLPSRSVPFLIALIVAAERKREHGSEESQSSSQINRVHVLRVKPSLSRDSAHWPGNYDSDSTSAVRDPRM